MNHSNHSGEVTHHYMVITVPHNVLRVWICAPQPRFQWHENVHASEKSHSSTVQCTLAAVIGNKSTAWWGAESAAADIVAVALTAPRVHTSST